MAAPSSFMKRLIYIFIGIFVAVLIVGVIVMPASWGEYGFYRGDAVHEEASLALIHGTNESCKTCHEEVYDIKKAGAHSRLSCETCHAPVTSHVKDQKKFADMPVKKGELQTGLCLNCHQKVIGRPVKFPMIDAKAHLEAQNVKATHDCARCHTVHDPLESMNYIKKLRTLREVINDE